MCLSEPLRSPESALLSVLMVSHSIALYPPQAGCAHPQCDANGAAEGPAARHLCAAWPIEPSGLAERDSLDSGSIADHGR